MLSYAWNVAFKGGRANRLERQKRRWKLLQSDPAAHVLFVDMQDYKFYYSDRYLLRAGFANACSIWIRRGYCPTDKDKRHAGGSNVLFCDGHVETMRFEDIWMRLNFEGAEAPPNGYQLK